MSIKNWYFEVATKGTSQWKTYLSTNRLKKHRSQWPGPQAFRLRVHRPAVASY
ncbi:MAG TPA: hypothetical protein VH540_24545 [Ktedonobacterales bacterium]